MADIYFMGYWFFRTNIIAIIGNSKFAGNVDPVFPKKNSIDGGELSRAVYIGNINAGHAIAKTSGTPNFRVYNIETKGCHAL
jgi:hypothetical protein